MQKSMKRLLSIILSFTMLFSSNCIAYGADEENVNNRAEKARVESLNESDEVQESDLQDPEYYKRYYNTDNSVETYGVNTTELQQYDGNSLARAGSGVLGCDVSKWQGNINWTQAKNAGIQYAFIRVAYRGRTDGIIRLDPNFRANIQNAINAGVKVGVYFYSEAINEREAIEEANTLISNIYMYNISMPLVIDYEGFNQNERIGQANLSKSAYTGIVSAFCEKVKSAGYTPMVYASTSYFTNYLEGEYLSNAYCIWSAAYSNPPEHYNSLKYDFWQFTSSANAVQYGMEPGSVDLDYWYAGRTIIGNDYSYIFDADYYYRTNNDLQSAIGNNPAELLYHFLNYGMSEGRRGNEIFDVKFYKNDNIDLQNAYGNDLKKYYYHYLTYGLTEGRQASENFDVKSYRFRYTKLQKAYGSDYKLCTSHYISFGKAEGLDATPLRYKVVFISDGQLIKRESVLCTRDAVAPNIVKNGYVLSWDKKYNNVVSDMTVTAQWTPATLSVKYDVTGGIVSNGSKKVTYLGNYGDLESPKRDGYTFTGWYTAANGGTQITKDTKVEVTSDQTIYAHWTANSYAVTFNADGGTVTANTKTVTFGNAYGELPTPTRSGYTFAGWWTAVDSGEQISFNSAVKTASDHVLYAHWVLNSVSVSYQTHVANIGWQNGVSNGAMAGTVGRGLQLEAIKINVKSDADIGVIYTTHVKNDGWHGNSFNGEQSGTTGQNKQVEALMLKLTGKDADKYDIYYRVHAQNYGWLAWAKNGEAAGTSGYAYRLEAIQIVVTAKGDAAPTTAYGGYISNNTNAYISKSSAVPAINTNASVKYQSHVRNVGWQSAVENGSLSGTTGRNLGLEAIKIDLDGQPCSGGIKYQTHVQNIGWQNTVMDGALAGTTGRALNVEAINMSLTGEMANQYDIYYRVHAQNYGWLEWAKNGQNAGTSGQNLHLEALQIVLVKKGQSAPGNNYGGIISKNTMAYIAR